MNLGERLKGARLRAGLNLRDLAAQVGVSAQAVSKYERGLDVPSSPILIRLCKALSVNLEFLMRPVSVTLAQPSYRRKASLTKKEQGIIQAQVQDWLERYLSIEAIVASPVEHEMPNIERTVKDLKQTESVALALRTTWNLGVDPIENLIAVLEAHGIKVGIVPGADDFDALTLCANQRMPIIVAKEGVPGDRQRFSIAHELGHMVLDCPEEWGNDLIEKAAYRFAGAFLAPAAAVYEELGEHRQRLDLYELHLLKHKYGMSMQAWIHRAQDLEIISSVVAAGLYKQFRVNKWHREEPGDQCPPETPERMDRLVIRALAEDAISESRATELLGSTMTQFWRHASKQHEGFPTPAGY